MRLFKELFFDTGFLATVLIARFCACIFPCRFELHFRNRFSIPFFSSRMSGLILRLPFPGWTSRSHRIGGSGCGSQQS